MQKNKLYSSFFIFIYIQVFFSCTTISAQNFADKNYYLVDSLELESISSKDQLLIKNSLEQFHNAENDSIKIDLVYNLVTKLKNKIVQEKYNFWILDYIKNNREAYQNKTLEEIVLKNQGKFNNVKGDYDQAIVYYLKSLELRKKSNDIDKIVAIKDMIAGIYKKKGNFIKALEYYNENLTLRKKTDNKKEVGRLLNTIGFLHLNFGMHTKALEYFHESLKYRDEVDDKIGASYCFNNIASVYKQQGKPNVALEYYFKSLKIREGLRNKKAISITLNNIGVVYKNQKEFDKALEYYQSSLVLKEEIKDRSGVSHVLNNIGTIYNEQGKLDMALVKYRESLEMTTAAHDEKWMAITLFNMGSVHLKQGNSIKALSCASRSLTLSKKIGQPELIRDAADVLKSIFSYQHNWKSAFEMQELYVTMRDSIRNKKTEADATEQRVTYEVQKKEQEIKLLSVQNDVLLREKEVQQLKLNKNKIVNAMFLVGGIVAFLLALFFYMVSMKRKSVNQLLQKQDEEKAILLKEIHHRVKNNLQVVNSLLRLQSKEIDDEEIVAKFKETQKRVITIAALHEKMYRSENLRHVNLKEHVESIVEDLITTYAIDKQITTQINIEDIKVGLRTLVPLGLIINEVIVNSLKYAFNDNNEAVINLQIKQLNDKTFEMLIGDNGVGISSHKKTSGLGSKLINIFTKQLNGSLEVLEDSGTTYKIVFEKIDPQ